MRKDKNRSAAQQLATEQKRQSQKKLTGSSAVQLMDLFRQPPHFRRQDAGLFLVVLVQLLALLGDLLLILLLQALELDPALGFPLLLGIPDILLPFLPLALLETLKGLVVFFLSHRLVLAPHLHQLFLPKSESAHLLLQLPCSAGLDPQVLGIVCMGITLLELLGHQGHGDEALQLLLQLGDFGGIGYAKTQVNRLRRAQQKQ